MLKHVEIGQGHTVQSVYVIFKLGVFRARLLGPILKHNRTQGPL